MSDLKQVKVDNWGIYFLQRLKHFFNRTDFCDLTLQFQDNAQLKVHRLVLNACTEYFELLERTCEMYEDCLVMPDDLQADVVVPIVNFMYTGQLEFSLDILEKLYQTSQIMNMPVLTKLLSAQRMQLENSEPIHDRYSGVKHYSKNTIKNTKQNIVMPSSSNMSTKRSYTQAFETNTTVHREKKQYTKNKTVKSDFTNNGNTYLSPSAQSSFSVPVEIIPPNKSKLGEPRPTRYELPEELDTDNIFENSFTDISYTSSPLIVHPETAKRYSAKKRGIFSNTDSKKFMQGSSTIDIVECKKITKDFIFEDNNTENSEMFDASIMDVKSQHKDTSKLFDQILDNDVGPKVTIEKDKNSDNMDHAKIISEVLKKYPHLVKSNKNIKLKILNKPKKRQPAVTEEEKMITVKSEAPDFTYGNYINSKVAAKLIAMGAENIKGPWICLICGTPGRALHFTSYYKFRRHLVEVHKEKPVPTICEYCGLKSLKRHYLLHHLYVKHGVEPPPPYVFPKCNLCSYIALTEGFLVKHKMTHAENKSFRCNVCAASFNTSNLLLSHIQNTGHKYSADRKTNLQCIYCLRVFMREPNLYAHLKTHHKQLAKNDGIIDDSDEEKTEGTNPQASSITTNIKYEIPLTYDNEYEEYTKCEIQQGGDTELQVVSKKSCTLPSPLKQKILNSGFEPSATKAIQKKKVGKIIPSVNAEYHQEVEALSPSDSNEEIIMIGDCEYIMKDNQIIPRMTKTPEDEYIISDEINHEFDQATTSTRSIEYTNMNNIRTDTGQQTKMIIKKSGNINQPIQFVVSNEEEYKALMSSNHSIIFDGDTNKTLTVLTAPHNTTLDSTSIDLENTQSNDMMIIQEDYPLNVSQSVSTDNPNIVVVYSHPVDDHNKQQYQLISTQNIETQYVPSSAVLTQNYETTSTPIMSTQIIHSQAEQTWQNTDQQSSNPDQTELQEMTVVEPIEVNCAENGTQNNIEELPEVHLVSDETQHQINEIEETIIQSNVVSEDVTQTEEHTLTQDVSTSIDIEVPTAVVDEKETDLLTSNENTYKDQNEIILQENVDDEILNTNEGQQKAETTVVEESDVQSEMQKEGDQTIIVDENVVTEITTNAEEEPNYTKNQDDTKITEILSTSNEEPVPIEPCKEQIQSLASEWSEDEEESVPQEQEIVNDDISKSNPENETVIMNASNDVEESIENIEQEMAKQMAQAAVIIKADEVVNLRQEDNLEKPKEIKQVVTNTVQASNVGAPQEKISSLLNDWEENDSQEGNEVINEDVTDQPIAETEENVPKGTDNEEKAESKEEDKIKNLVSDWDDDEEEQKN